MIPGVSHKRLTVILLITSLSGWFPCPCLGNAATPEGKLSEPLCNHCLAHESTPDRGSCPAQGDCCCDQGHCKPPAAVTMAAKTIEWGPQLAVKAGSGSLFDLGSPAPAGRRGPLPGFILSNYRPGYLYPDIPWLVI